MDHAVEECDGMRAEGDEGGNPCPAAERLERTFGCDPIRTPECIDVPGRRILAENIRDELADFVVLLDNKRPRTGHCEPFVACACGNREILAHPSLPGQFQVEPVDLLGGHGLNYRQFGELHVGDRQR